MNVGARKRQTVGAGRWRRLFALSVGVMPMVSTAQSGGVALRIELTAESAEDLRAWRRAQGLEPPLACDGAAAPSRPVSRDAQRRMRRTFVLDDAGAWQPLVPDGHAFAAAACAAAPRAR